MNHDGSSSSGLLTLQEASLRVGVSVRTLRRYQRQGRLAVVRVGRRVYCAAESIAHVATPANGVAAAAQMLRPNWETRRVGEWAVACRAFVEMVFARDGLAPPRLRAIEKMVQRFGPVTVGEYRLEHLASIETELAAEGERVEEIAMLLLLPPTLLVIEALRELRRRFAGIPARPPSE